MFAELKEKFAALDKRDQIMLGVLALALALYILVGQLWLGIMDSRDLMAKRVAANDKLITWMQGSVNEIMSLKGGGSASAADRLSLSQLAQQAAKKSNLRMSRFQPKGDEGQVWLDKVPFSDVLSFLVTLEQQYGVTVLSSSINTANQAGLVNARIKFQK